MDRIRFTLIKDGKDIRPFDYATEEVQIGCDPNRGDNLLIDLPKGLRHIRALILRTSDGYVELEVRGGPIWLQGSKMEEGDVAELTAGDILIFGTRKDGGPKLRFEEAKEAEIVMDDVADWSVSAAPKSRRGAEDDLEFEEEIDEYEGLNAWQKYLKWYRKQYAKFATWRKKAARVKYWMSVVKTVQKKAGKIMAVGLGVAAIGGAQFASMSRMWKAQDEAVAAGEAQVLAVAESKQNNKVKREIAEKMRQCGCDDAVGIDAGALAAADAILNRFGGDTSLNPEATVILPDKSSVSYATLIGKYQNAALKNRTTIPRTINRVCSASADKERMDAVIREVSRYGIPEAYAFVPFVESYWCELAVSHTGPRGMMQFTRRTAEAAWRKIDSSQADIPPYDYKAHRDWLLNRAKTTASRSYFNLLSQCTALDRLAYKEHFYPGPSDPKYPNRIDPRDPRTDWKSSTEAAFSWLAYLHGVYTGRGWREMDATLLAMSAYNQGEGEIQRWINAGKTRYSIKSESNLTYPQIYAGGMVLLQKEANAEKKRQIAEGMAYGPKIVGTYLAVADTLDAKNCR
jgi:hypothetical protein